MRACEVTFTCLALLLLTPAARPIRVVIHFGLLFLDMISTVCEVVQMYLFPASLYRCAMKSVRCLLMPIP